MRESSTQHTEKQSVAIKTTFATRRRRQIILAIPVILIVVLLALSEKNQLIAGIPPVVVGSVACAIIVGSLIFSLYNWRCPACNKYLGKGISPKYCAKCGVQLS